MDAVGGVIEERGKWKEIHLSPSNLTHFVIFVDINKYIWGCVHQRPTFPSFLFKDVFSPLYGFIP
jgi:hypothetical protein